MNVFQPLSQSFIRQTTVTSSESAQNSEDFPEAISCYHHRHVSRTTYPKLSQQKMADFLVIKRERLAWALREGIVSHDGKGFYDPEAVTKAWLAYERSPRARSRGRMSSEFE